MRRRGATDVAGFPFERGDLGVAELLAAGGEAVVDRPGVPVHLVHRPGHDRWLRQALHVLCLVARECPGERGAPRYELLEGASIYVGNLRVERAHPPII